MAVAAAATVSDALRRRVLLIAPHGSYRTAPFITAVRRLNAEVLVASEGEHSLVSDYANGLHIPLSHTDEALRIIGRAAQTTPFSAVIGTDDVSTELAALASARLGLPHNPLSAVRTARRKDLARRCLTEAGVPVPRYRQIDLTHNMAQQLNGISFPCVIKPLALSASRGVIRADNPDELYRAIARVSVMLAGLDNADERSGLLVEEFISGTEHTVEALLVNGHLKVLAIFDKPDPLDGPYFEETYYITPSRQPAAVQEQIRLCVDRACRAYGLCEGPVHAEVRINREGVWILEVAARTIGGLCGRLLRFGTGHDLEELVLLHAMNLPVATVVREGGAGVLMIPVPQAGILRRVEGLMAAESTPYVEEVVIDVREGYELVPLPEGASYLGFIFSRAPDAQTAEAALRAAHACLRIVVAPLWKGRSLT